MKKKKCQRGVVLHWHFLGKGALVGYKSCFFYFITEYLEEQLKAILYKWDREVFPSRKQRVWFTVDGEEKNGIGDVREILLRVREIQRESGSNFPWMERSYIICVLHKPSARWNDHRKLKTVFHKSIYLHLSFSCHVFFSC